MNLIKLFIYKIRKGLYLILEVVQDWLLPEKLRSGKYFDIEIESEKNLNTILAEIVDTPQKKQLLKELDAKGLFIIGNARSGTTILRQVFNSSEDVRLLSEANLFDNINHRKFIEEFNSKGRRRGEIERKSSFILPFPGQEENILEMLARIGSGYAYFGDKIATNLNTNFELLFQFQTVIYPNSKYFFIVREPAEVVWSMTKMFPRLETIELFASWLKTLDFILRTYFIFPNSNVIFLESVNSELVPNLERILKIKLGINPARLQPASQRSSITNDEYPQFLVPYSSLITQCQKVFKSINQAFCQKTYRLNSGKYDARYLQNCRNQVISLLEILERFDPISLEGRLAICSHQDREALAYLTGLPGSEIKKTGFYPEYNSERVLQNLLKYFSKGDLSESMSSVNSSKIKIWALEKCIHMMRRSSQINNSQIFYRRLMLKDHDNPIRKYFEVISE